MIIGIDFDGTIVEHEFPQIGAPIIHAHEVMLELNKKGHKIILFTMRSDLHLNAAVKYLKDCGIELYGINVNPTQSSWTSSPKAYCQLYIDDAALGCPLIYPADNSKRPHVDWNIVRSMLQDRGIL